MLATLLRSMPERLADWGYRVSTGPLVWNRHKSQLRGEPGKGKIPLVWAECITSDGRFIFRSERRNHLPFFKPGPDDDWLVVRSSCVLLQRTTAKEQARRLIAAEMPAPFVTRNGGVTVENHLNMMVPTVAKPAVSPALLAAFFNSVAADRAFRCLSGSVAVSAYELENLPLPAADDLKQLLGRRVDRGDIEVAAARLYDIQAP
jgi:adenine-specific DNA-methyltransferase